MANTTPYEIEIFKAGKRTASNGVTLDFPVAKLQEVVETYNPKVFRAPAIVSHDTAGVDDSKIANTFDASQSTKNKTAARELCYGFPTKLKLVGGNLKASFEKMAPQLVQWVREGMLHSISPSFYLPNSPNNPYPGKLSLRHIAFLGKTPPAVKGLEPLPEPPLEWSESEFGYIDFNINDPEEGVISFSMGLNIMSSPWLVAADLFQRYREFLIDSENLETAERVLPTEEIANLRQLANSDTEKNQKIAELQSEISELSQALEDLQNSDDDSDYEDNSEEYENQISELQAEISALKSELANGSESGSYWQQVCDQQKGLIDSLQMQVSNYENGSVGNAYSPLARAVSYGESPDYVAAMKSLKMTTADVAEATGIDETKLKKFVAGKAKLSAEQIEELNGLLELDYGSMQAKLDKKQAELEYRESQLDELQDSLNEREDELQQREAEITTQQQQIEYSETTKFVDGLVQEGKLNAARRDRTIHLLLNTDNSSKIEFSEGEVLSPRQELMGELSSRKAWNFSETIVKGDEIPARSAAPIPGATQNSDQQLQAVLNWCQANGKDPDNMANFNEALSVLNITF